MSMPAARGSLLRGLRPGGGTLGLHLRLLVLFGLASVLLLLSHLRRLAGGRRGLLLVGVRFLGPERPPRRVRIPVVGWGIAGGGSWCIACGGSVRAAATRLGLPSGPPACIRWRGCAEGRWRFVRHHMRKKWQALLGCMRWRAGADAAHMLGGRCRNWGCECWKGLDRVVVCTSVCFDRRANNRCTQYLSTRILATDSYGFIVVVK